MAAQDWVDKDFYKTLGISKDADSAAIKKAYRRLARKYHPDQNPGNKQAEEKFKAIGEAYSVLSDEEQRKQYDAIRAMSGGGARFSAGPGGNAGASGFEDVFASMFGDGTGRGGASSANIDLSSLLGGMFGGGGQGRSGVFSSTYGGGGGSFPGTRSGRTGAPAPKGADLLAKTTLSFRQAMRGSTVKIKVDGKSMTVRIPAKVKDGQKIRIKGRGRSGPGGDGDLLITVHVTPDPAYSWDGKILQIKLPITPSEAILGATVRLELLDGKHVKVKVPAGTSSGARLRLRGKGIDRGDAVAIVEIKVPSGKPTPAVKKAAEALAQAIKGENPGFEPRAQVS